MVLFKGITRNLQFKKEQWKERGLIMQLVLHKGISLIVKGYFKEIFKKFNYHKLK